MLNGLEKPTKGTDKDELAECKRNLRTLYRSRDAKERLDNAMNVSLCCVVGLVDSTKMTVGLPQARR